jgi:uncharacterized protein (DUF488 family)
VPGPRVLTIGHSTHEAAAFVELLRRHRVGLLADVRRHPGSRRVPQFNSGELAHALREAGIEYLHLPELGGRRRPAPDSPNAGWKSEQFRGYADHMESEEFAAALGRLMELAHERRVALMCAEAQWRRCHRRLLSDALVARGAEVMHIDASGGIEPHRLTEFALVERGRVSYPPEQAALDV